MNLATKMYSKAFLYTNCSHALFIIWRATWIIISAWIKTQPFRFHCFPHVVFIVSRIIQRSEIAHGSIKSSSILLTLDCYTLSHSRWFKWAPPSPILLVVTASHYLCLSFLCFVKSYITVPTACSSCYEKINYDHSVMCNCGFILASAQRLWLW